jgi:receptor protein-tyrosine kinase
MSTIEKAIGKLGQNGDPEKETGAPVPPAVGAAEKATSQGGGAAADKVSTSTPANSVHSMAEGKTPIELPLLEFDEKGMVTPFTPRSRIAEEFRAIKRPLLRNTEVAGADKANLIMVTSALKGDGKTFTALNLALSIAMEEDRTVLFVDADVATAEAGELQGQPGPDRRARKQGRLTGGCHIAHQHRQPAGIAGGQRPSTCHRIAGQP